VWKRGHFGWEYKGKRKDLNAAFAQLQQYALALEHPPLLVVCDLDRFRIRTNWTNSVSEVHEFALDDFRDGTIRQKLKWVLSDPEKLKPGTTRQALTEQVAGDFAKLAQRLRDNGDRTARYPSPWSTPPSGQGASRRCDKGLGGEALGPSPQGR
jgi:hypothetical protein